MVLWFEDDLYDQLQLLQVLDRLRDHHGPIPLVDLPRPPRGASRGRSRRRGRWAGGRCAAGRPGLGRVHRPDPRVVQAVAVAGTPGLPDVAPALERLLEEHPATTDGLARTERQILAPWRRASARRARRSSR